MTRIEIDTQDLGEHHVCPDCAESFRRNEWKEKDGFHSSVTRSGFTEYECPKCNQGTIVVHI